MARSLAKSRMLRSGLEYLEERYPGISNDAVGYRHERHASGEEYLVSDHAPGGDPS